MDDLGGKPTIFGNIHIRKHFSHFLYSHVLSLCKPRHGLGVQRWFDGAVRASQQIPGICLMTFEFSRPYAAPFLHPGN